MMRSFRTPRGRIGLHALAAFAASVVFSASVPDGLWPEARQAPADRESASRVSKIPFLHQDESPPAGPEQTAFAKPDLEVCVDWAFEPPARSSSSSPSRVLSGDSGESLSFLMARCWEALGLEEDAVQAYRRHLERYPEGRTRAPARSSLFGLLSRQKNFRAIVSLAEAIKDKQESLSPEDLFVVGQSLYRLGDELSAQPYLESVPPESAVFPYARFTRAQIEYKKGKAESALSLLDPLCSLPGSTAVPPFLQDYFLLIRARILYQLGRYAEAAEGFRSLQPSSPFLPEALMGLAWSYDALGDRAKAISYFLAVENAPASPSEITQARMEAARIYSEVRDDPDATELFHRVQTHLMQRIAQYRKWAESEEWLTEASRSLLDPGGSSAFSNSGPAAPEDVQSFRQEVLALLTRERSRPGPVRDLLEAKEALDRISLKLQTLEGRLALTLQPVPSTPSSLFPPLDPPVRTVGAPLPALLDVWLNLLFAETRLLRTAAFWGLTHEPERNEWDRSGVPFYRSLVEDILFPPVTGADTQASLDRLQSSVRHLPFSLEEREKILEKILSFRRSIEQTATGLADTSSRIETLAGASQSPTEQVRLRVWMAYARSLAELRILRDGSPLFLLAEESFPESVAPASDISIEPFETRVTERVDQLRGLLLTALERHVSRFHRDRVVELRRLLADSRRLFADSLLLRQREITRDLSASDNEKDQAPPEGAEPKNP